MSFFTPLGIVILSTLILSFLQLSPGVFALFSHYATGKYRSKKRALLATFFILGAETVSACLFLASLLFVNLFFLYNSRPEASFLIWIIIGALLALTFISFFCYYRPGKNSGSQLFIPRKCAETLDIYASKVNSRSDAFTLGALTGVLELPFSLPLLIGSALAIIELFVACPPSIFLALLFLIAPVAPLILIRLRYRAGYNLADIMRLRIKNKSAVRFVLFFSYLALTILFIMEFINANS